MSLSIYLLSIYWQLMYQHFLAVQQFFFPIDFFFCCLWHADILSRRKTEWKLLPHTLRYFSSMDSYFDKQSSRPDFICLKQREFFPEWFKNPLWVQISVSHNLSQIKWAIQIFFWPAVHSTSRKARRQWTASTAAYLGVNPNQVLILPRLHRGCQLHYSNIRHLAY